MLQVDPGVQGTWTPRGATWSRRGRATHERSFQRLAEAVLGHHVGRRELRALLIDHLRLLSGADLALLAEVAADGDAMLVDGAAGVGAEHLRGAMIPLAGTVAAEALRLSASGAMCPDTVVVADDLWSTRSDLLRGPTSLGPAVIVPVGPVAAAVRVVVVANVAARRRVDGAELARLRAFAPQVAQALRDHPVDPAAGVIDASIRCADRVQLVEG